MRSSGQSVMRSSGQSVMRSSGQSVMRSSGQSVMRSKCGSLSSVAFKNHFRQASNRRFEDTFLIHLKRKLKSADSTF